MVRKNTKKAQEPMTVEWVEITALKPSSANPNTHKAGISEIAESIRTFGWTQPVVANSKGDILVGEGRYLAAMKLNQTHVPVRYFQGSRSRQLALIAADNQTGTFSKVDDDMLAALMQQISPKDRAVTGFSDASISKMLAGFDDAMTPPSADPGGGSAGGSDAKVKKGPCILIRCESDEHRSTLVHKLSLEGLAEMIETIDQ